MATDKELTSYLEMYADKFEDCFPTFMASNLSNDQIIEEIEKAINTGKPFEPALVEGEKY